MPILAVIAAMATAVWGTFVARRMPLVVGCAIFLVVSYVFGPDFWHALGPLPITVDRLAAIGLLGAVVVQWRLGKLSLRLITGSDWLVAGLIAILAVSAVLAGSPAFEVGGSSPWGRLAIAFVLPGLLYAAVRLAPITPRQWTTVLVGLTILGVYLAATAVCEHFGVWSLVFPRYIANPNLGIHFGRARGPGLNSASLGMYLTACGFCAYLLLWRASPRWQKLALLSALPLLVFGIFATYTRSTWLGFAASIFVVAAIEIPRRLRMPALVVCGLVGLLVLAGAWGQLVGLQREGTAAEAEHSIDQRASFAYVSWQMFKDHPIFGVGFGRFYDHKLPYLSDRSQAIELESIRPLHHHNTLLSLLTETGIIGLASFVGVLVVWGREAWRLVCRQDGAAGWPRAQGLLMLALLANYLCSALFHDLTLVPAQHSLLFLFAGVTVSLRQDAVRGLGTKQYVHRDRFPRKLGRKIEQPVVELFGMKLSRVTMRDAVSQVLEWCAAPRGATCRYVVTPNVDHAVLFQEREDLRDAYEDASLVLADGAPIVLASRLISAKRSQCELPERVAGSDLVPQLFTSTQQTLRVYLLGAAPGVAEAAAKRIERKWAWVEIVGCLSPPIGFEKDDAESAKILQAVSAASPDVLVIGLGAPKQELWVHQHHRELQAKVALCVGATIDFLAGEKSRSPVWMRRAGLEWAHRVISEPRRLAGRYARDAWVFPRLVWREILKGER